MNIIEKLKDLVVQATTDRSHYYVKSVCLEAIAEIEYLRKLRDSAGDAEDKSIIARFFSKVDVKRKNECWIWKSAKKKKGYGEISIHNKTISAHVFSYKYFKGEIPSGFWIDHICMKKDCVNPNHLRAVTPRINALENSNSVSSINYRKTHCNRGHELAGNNLLMRTTSDNGNPTRVCKLCVDIARSARLKKKKALTAFREKHKKGDA